MRKIAFPGSFDPMTLGHLDIARRGANILNNEDTLVIAHGVNSSKKGLLALQEKLPLAQEAAQKAISDLHNNVHIEVDHYEGMLNRYAFLTGAKGILRGLRNSTDLNYEQTIESALKSQSSSIELLFLLADPKYHHVSSSTTKELLRHGGRLEQYVPINIKQYIEAIYNQQYKANITGTIGSGKSYVTEKLVEIGEQWGVPTHNIDLDRIGHDILNHKEEQGYQAIRQELANHFGEEILDDEGFINRKELGKVVFADPVAMDTLNKIMKGPIHDELFVQMQGVKGLLLLNAPLTAEGGISQFGNNETILIDVDPELQRERLRSRNLDEAAIDRRINSQFTTEAKRDSLQQRITQDFGMGTITEFANNNANDEEIEKLYLQLLTQIDVDGRLRYHSLMHRLGVDLSDQPELQSKTYEALKERYLEPHRYYHNLQHIVHLLNLAYTHQKEFENFEAVELAIWWHDAIYNIEPGKASNEQLSIELLRKDAQELGIDDETIEQALLIIEATEVGETAKTLDSQILADMDRSTLAGDLEEFTKYRDNIRKEYDVPDKLFINGSIDFFEKVISTQQPIFQSTLGKELREDKAISNAEREIARLRAMQK